jgi:glutamyl-tRNA synthetase/glutamyl-Q tRNA(Asp) synthetase
MLRDRLGNWTYQFAVVTDDRDQGVDLVIRGVDLLPSTGRQFALAAMLGRGTPPGVLHHPLVRTAGGRKLSKADRDAGIRDLRGAGWTPERVLGAALHALGTHGGGPLPLQEALNLFSSPV